MTAVTMRTLSARYLRMKQSDSLRLLTTQFLRFLLVGLVNAAFGYGIFALLIGLDFPPMPALGIAYVVGVVFNFFTTGSFVFGARGWRRFGGFVLAYAVIYLFNAALYWLVATTNWGPLAVQAICLPVVAIFSFILFKFQVFRVRP